MLIFVELYINKNPNPSSSMIHKTIVFPQLGNLSVDYSVGRNAADNFDILDQAKDHHLWFHVEGQSSCHVIAAIPEDVDRKNVRYLVKQGAILCKQYTTSVRAQSKITIIYARVSDVEKTDIVGSVVVTNGKTVII